MGNVVGWGEILLVLATCVFAFLFGRKSFAWRRTCLGVLAVIAGGPLAYTLTGLSLNLPTNHRLQGEAALLAYLLLIPLLWLAGLTRVGKVIGRAFSVVLIFGVRYAFIANLAWVLFMGSYRASGSLGGGYTYQLDGKKALIGAADYTSYFLYKTVPWLPFTKQLVNQGPLGTDWRGGPIRMRRSVQGRLEVYEVAD